MAENIELMEFTDIYEVFREYQVEFEKECECNLIKDGFGPPGVLNSHFLYRIFGEKRWEERALDLLEDASLLRIRPAPICECGKVMHLIKRKDVLDKCAWYCGSSAGKVLCQKKRTIRKGSFFDGSKLPIGTIVLLIFNIFDCSSFYTVHRDLSVGSHTFANWRQYITDTIVEFIETATEKIGGVGKTVEIYESEFGKSKYNKGHFVEGQWVFCGVERETGRCFLVVVHDRTAEALIGVFEEWIEPRTQIISDCCKAYNQLGGPAFDHLTVNHSLHFMDSETEARTNTVESTWRHDKTSLPEYNRKGDFGGYIGWFMFSKICQAINVDPFVKFLDVIRRIDWPERKIVSGGVDDGSEI